MQTYPTCINCGGEINPVKYDGCEKTYGTEDGELCPACFIQNFTEYLERNPDEVAEMYGIRVRRLT